MTRRVLFSPEANDDLRQLFVYISDRAGSRIAGAYLDLIEARCLDLRDFPDRGVRRDNIWPGLRTVSLERRVTVAFTAGEQDVTIVRILYGGRNLEGAFEDPLP